MVSIVSELELMNIDRLSRPQLIDAVRARSGELPADLLDQLEDRSTDRLQLLLLAGRLIQVLRHLERAAKLSHHQPVCL